MIKQFLNVNKIIKDKRVFIYAEDGFNENSIKALIICMNMGIYIEGFINTAKSNQEVFGRKIYSIEEIYKLNNVLFISDVKNEYNVKWISYRDVITINEEIIRNRICVYGLGNVGKSVYNYLVKKSINPLYLFDKNLYNTELDGKKINKLENIIDFKNKTSIIISMNDYEIVLKEISSKNNCDIFLQKYKLDELFINIILGQTILSIPDLYSMCHRYSKDKHYFLWGNEALANEVKTLFELLDYDRVDIINDENIDDILYYEDGFVIIVDNSLFKSDYIKKLGAEWGKDYDFLRYNGYDKKNIERRKAFEIKLGHSFVGNTNKIIGTNVLGNIESTKLIVVLGGSTSDGSLYDFKSWPEIFKQKFLKSDVTIVNMAVDAYDSLNEFIRIKMDAIPLKPILIIALNGVNDCINRKVKQERDYEKIIYDHVNYEVDLNVCYGLSESEELSNASRWYNNVKSARILSEGYEIPYICFLQPHLKDKKNKTEIEKMLYYDIATDESESFYNKARAYASQESYIYDISLLFEEKEVNGFDRCHVYERGNEVLADKIYELIKKSEEYNNLCKQIFR